ncbi:hypothetical protein Cycma_0222 [Cyclobacterium marinum DSM 745]|uniref:Uncharacterized protein n=1 Tax=Cyclobacterium marinum (strain ATCC 25205 / DSM 745 / LMG 13164 / NCIMB 1802) TaxID=880070 RepID=G0J1Z8_CYCMS|nr:hypothetical protein Cycma_0222 [Cyclobacterium marinum DSM 745]
MIRLFILFIILYWLLFGDFKIDISTKTKKYEIEYNGVIWVALDCWSIWRYHSYETPIKWFSITITVSKDIYK